MSPLEKALVLYKNTQVGIVTRLPELSEIDSLTEEVRSGQNDLQKLPDELDA